MALMWAELERAAVPGTCLCSVHPTSHCSLLRFVFQETASQAPLHSVPGCWLGVLSGKHRPEVGEAEQDKGMLPLSLLSGGSIAGYGCVPSTSPLWLPQLPDTCSVTSASIWSSWALGSVHPCVLPAQGRQRLPIDVNLGVAFPSPIWHLGSSVTQERNFPAEHPLGLKSLVRILLNCLDPQ